MKKLLIILFWFVGLIISGQSTYYVATTGTDGAGVSGDITHPWKTITYSITRISGQDTLKVRGGTYNEKVYIGYVKSIPGISSKHTVIKAYTGEISIIDGAGVVTSADWPLIYIYDNYVDFTGFTVRNTTSDINGPDGIRVYTSATHVTIGHCTIHDVFGSGIVLQGDYGIAEYNTVYNTCMNNYGGATPVTNGQAITACRYPNYCIIRHNLCHDIWGEGISTFEATHTTIEDNIIYDAWSVYLYISDVTDCIVQRNLVYRVGTMGVNGSHVGIAHYNEGKSPANARNTIINNIVYGCQRNLFCADPLINLFVANNTFVNSTYFRSVQINYMAGEANSIFKNNIVIQEGALDPINYDGTQSGMIFSNNLYNKAYDADAHGAGDVISVAHFVDSVAHNYQLKASSPAINVGALIGVNTDFLDSLRDGSPDIGAYEYNPPVAPPSMLPSVISQGITSVNVISAVSGGNVTGDGGGTITARGVCWSTGANPVVGGSHTTNGSGLGVFTSAITGLIKSTTYHVRAYATNSAGTAYGNDISFRTPAYSILRYMAQIVKIE